MKKILIVLLSAMLIFTGCGAGREDSVSEPESLPQEEPAASAEPELSGDNADASADEESPPLTQRLTIPEGYTLARIGMTLEDMGVCTAEEFIEAAETGDYSDYPLLAEQEENPNRCFDLEGYLFPDTYEIYTAESPNQIIKRILDHTESKISSDIREQIAISGYTTDEIITMASIIEKEAFGEDIMPLISSVLHNRLNIGMRIQCDVTITYVTGAIQPFITGDENRYNDFYNTYTCKALPAGAICNPGLPAIIAALNPEESDYLFFVTDEDKGYHFAETFEEHDAKVKELGI